MFKLEAVCLVSLPFLTGFYFKDLILEYSHSPVFWEEGGQPFGQIEVTRPVAATLPAFSRHFESLIDEYSNVHVLNLLSSRDQEALLTSAFENNLRSADDLVKSRTTMTAFDFHARTAVGGIDSLMSQLLAVVGTDLEQIASSLVSIDEKGVDTLLIGQRGIMRTNCKDSLGQSCLICSPSPPNSRSYRVFAT
jgi:hypothetical protein